MFEYGPKCECPLPQWVIELSPTNRMIELLLRTVFKFFEPSSGVTVCIVLIALLASNVGCQVDAPVHVWKPAEIAGLSGVPVVLMEIEGDQQIASRVHEQLLQQSKFIANSPGQSRLAGTARLIASQHLAKASAPDSVIRLVSGFSDPVAADRPMTELEVAAQARRAGLPYLLRGHLIEATGQDQSAQHLAMTWHLVGLADGTTTDGRPVSVNQSSIKEKYPQLLGIVDPRERLIQAIALESLALLAPMVDRKSASLVEPRFVLGSRLVREGVDHALAGNWPKAESVWERVIEKYPRQNSALINASIAAVSRQDFETAKHRITRAISQSWATPTLRKHAQEILVWIELQQRDYHRAFNLPDPLHGWLVLNDDVDVQAVAAPIGALSRPNSRSASNTSY